ncbi:hypothetical protein BDQ17DRAFT_1335632 [Cyathus striatus]|nr:hypothetical protein BDQ17DRAFT_1335632 [Cyathus striatus]
MSVLNNCFNTMDGEFNYEMKTQLQDHLSTLLLQFNRFKTSIFVGYTTFPQNYTISPTLDRTIIHYLTFLGGPLNVSLSMGKTALHKAGHWVGLYHMFQSGHYGEGDMVDDTPAEDDSTY